jgi:hypothetical protein
MTRTHSFRFADKGLNNRLIALLQEEARGRYSIDDEGTIHYSHDDEDLVGNTLICSVRDSVFEAWQVISFSEEWAESYRRYMEAKNVPFQEEIRDGQLRFLIPANYRPHSWKLEEPHELRRRKAAI